MRGHWREGIIHVPRDHLELCQRIFYGSAGIRPALGPDCAAGCAQATDCEQILSRQLLDRLVEAVTTRKLSKTDLAITSKREGRDPRAVSLPMDHRVAWSQRDGVPDFRIFPRDSEVNQLQGHEQVRRLDVITSNPSEISIRIASS